MAMKFENFVRNMNNSPPPPTPPSPGPSIALAVVLGVIAVLACGIPFVPPLAVVAVPLAGGSLIIMARVIRRGTRWSPGRAINAVVAVALAGFALFLDLGQHH